MLVPYQSSSCFNWQNMSYRFSWNADFLTREAKLSEERRQIIFSISLGQPVIIVFSSSTYLWFWLVQVRYLL